MTVMYHYVGESLPLFPARRGMPADCFARQIDYLASTRHVVSIDQVIKHVLDGEPLPSDPCLLTFDDGLLDHRVTVLPLLAERDLPAVFFVSAGTVDGREVLDVHKVQSILATEPDVHDLAGLIAEVAAAALGGEAWARARRSLADLAMTNRFDDEETAFVKMFLQRGPEPARSQATDLLFESYVPISVPALAAELYLSRSDVRALLAGGMAIGGHGLGHPWLSTLDRDGQRTEISGSRDLLADILGGTPDRWTFAYPFGDYDAGTLALLAEYGCALAFSTAPAIARRIADPLRIPRLDCNDIRALPATAG